MSDYPEIDVIVATRDRHELLLATLAGIESQDYPGTIRTILVYDNYPVRADLARHDSNRPIVVTSNSRSPGLAGSRNTGLQLSGSPIVAFCDDDDIWRPSKASDQVKLMSESNALGSVTGIQISYGDDSIERIPALPEIDSESILGSRLTGAHPSSYMFYREPLLSRVGLVDEEIPFGYGEDYDLLIRAVAAGRVMVVQKADVDVLWHKGGSYFSRRWEAMDAGIEYLTTKHPGLVATKRTAGWLNGQRAFAQASHGRRRESLSTAWSAFRLDPRQPRAYLAVGVALGVLKPKWVVDQLNARGRGI